VSSFATTILVGTEYLFESRVHNYGDRIDIKAEVQKANGQWASAPAPIHG